VKTRRLITLLLFSITLACIAALTQPVPDKQSLSIGIVTIKGPPARVQLLVDVVGMSDYQAFLSQGPGSDCSNYKLYETHPSLDATQPPQVILVDLFDPLAFSENGRLTSCQLAGANRIRFQLKDGSCLSSDSSYVLIFASGVTKLQGSFTLTYKISTPDPLLVRSQIMIRPAACLGSPTERDISVVQIETEVKAGTLIKNHVARTFKVKSVVLMPQGVKVNVEPKFLTGASVHLKVTVKRSGQNDTEIDGTVTVPDVPKTDKDAKVVMNVGGTAAVASAPSYTATGNLALLHPPDSSVLKPSIGLWNGYLDPSATFDVGANSPSSANSIIGSVPDRWEWWPGDVSLSRSVEGQTYRSSGIVGMLRQQNDHPSGNLSISHICAGHPLSTVSLAVGPRAEIDQSLHRETLLGEVRVEAHPCLLDWTIANRKALYTSVSPDTKDLESPNFGFQWIPYLSFDGGSSLFDQQVSDTKTKTSVLVPQHGIARLYAGFSGSVEFPIPLSSSWQIPLSIDFNESGFYLGPTETIGYVDKKKGALIRTVQGLQPYSKLTFSLFLNQNRHYALNVIYQDGRTAPNFAYLNTVQYGIKVIY
jgi:hypothetical protein